MTTVARFKARRWATLCCLLGVTGGCDSTVASQPAAVANRVSTVAPGEAAAAEVSSTAEETSAAAKGLPETFDRTISAAALAAVLPGRVGNYEALAPAGATERPLAAKRVLPHAVRRYSDGMRTLVLEIMDPLHSPNVLAVVRRGQQQSERTPDRMTEGADIGGQWVVTQWTGADQSARIGALIAGRLIYSFTLSPADSIEPALEVAAAMNYPVAEALLPPASR